MLIKRGKTNAKRKALKWAKESNTEIKNEKSKLDEKQKFENVEQPGRGHV